MSDVRNAEPDNQTSTIEHRLMEYRLAYKKESYVNWCEALGTVLANDEVINGVSERGGHLVERKLMSQWFLRITAFAERLLTSLDDLDFPESLKEMQRNWIGKSVGAEIKFDVRSQISDVSNTDKTDNQHPSSGINVFTTRPDTIFGVSFIVLAPEHELVNLITTTEQNQLLRNIKKSLHHEVNVSVWLKQKRFQGVSPVHMPFILSQEKKFQFGFQNMFWLVMVLVLSWLCLVAMSVIMLLQNILI